MFYRGAEDILKDRDEELEEDEGREKYIAAYDHKLSTRLTGLTGQLGQDEYDEAAAPNLVSLQILPSPSKFPARWGSSGVWEFNTLHGCFKHIANLDQIKMLQTWIHCEDNCRGGMGSNGTMSTVATKDARLVEAELTEWAKSELERSRSAQDRLLERFRAQARAALPAKKRKRAVTINDIEDEPEYDYGCFPEADAKRLRTNDTSPSEDDEVQVKIELGLEPALDAGDIEQDRSMSTSAPTGGLADGPNRHTRHAENRRQASNLRYRQFLQLVVEKMPNLVGLSIQRRDGTRLDLTETRSDLDEFAKHYVEPLAKLGKLRYLDLGLAVSGLSEVSDFPLGLSLSTTRSARGKAKGLDPALQAMKRRKYTLDMMKAKIEGDQWRKIVLERCFGLPSSVPADEDTTTSPTSIEPSTGPGSGSASAFGGGGEGGESKPKLVWPESLRSGCFIAPDLENRIRYRGLMIPWKIEEEKVVLGAPVKTRL